MIYLIDASVFIFRAWYSFPTDMIDPGSNPVNALYGFARFLGDFIEQVEPSFVAVAFDSDRTGQCVRAALYPAYKAHRDPPPPELRAQFERCRAVTRALGLAGFADARYEADDLIAAQAGEARLRGRRITILSRDKDLVQALRPGDSLWDYPNGRRLAYERVAGVYGVSAEQIADLLALTGDPVDNVPGINGVGPKTAAALLRRFGSIDGIYANLEAVGRMKMRMAAGLPARLRDSRASLDIARQLTVLREDAPVMTPESALAVRPPDLDTLGELYDEAGFGVVLRRQAERLRAKGLRRS